MLSLSNFVLYIHVNMPVVKAINVKEEEKKIRVVRARESVKKDSKIDKKE